MTEPSYRRHNSTQTLAMLDELTEVYEEIHSGSPEYDYLIYRRDHFIPRTEEQAAQEGFELVTVHADGQIAGFSFGFPFAPGGWWAGTTKPTVDLLDATKFAVIELDVRRAYRGQGWGRALLDKLLADRQEDFATLTAIRDSTTQAMYERWDWFKVAAFDGEPVMDVMVLPLKSD
ncbi:MAG: GNAT family N-acetyltransferase [Pseudonocardia sp.]